MKEKVSNVLYAIGILVLLWGNYLAIFVFDPKIHIAPWVNQINQVISTWF